MGNPNSTDRLYNIIRFLQNRPSSIKEIQVYLENKDDAYKVNLKTIRRDFEKIDENYHFKVSYDKKERVYRIDKKNEDDFKERMLDSLAVMNALKQTETARKYIFLEKKQSSGTEYLHDIIEAIENKNSLSFTLNSYWNEPSKRKCAPIAIKEAMKRWYLVAYDIDKKEIRNYGLDRISNFRTLDEKFSPPFFDVEEHYQHAFGIENYYEPTHIILRFDISQFNYLESLPLHHSQKITETKNGYFLVNLFIHPTYELKMEILKFGENCEVIEPLFYRDELKNTINKLKKMYNKKINN